MPYYNAYTYDKHAYVWNSLNSLNSRDTNNYTGKNDYGTNHAEELVFQFRLLINCEPPSFSVLVTHSSQDHQIWTTGAKNLG